MAREPVGRRSPPSLGIVVEAALAAAVAENVEGIAAVFVLEELDPLDVLWEKAMEGTRTRTRTVAAHIVGIGEEDGTMILETGLNDTG